VRGLLDQGPFTPRKRVRQGLVDDLAYEDQLDDRVPEMRSGSANCARSTATSTKASARVGRHPDARAHRRALRRGRRSCREERIRSAERVGRRSETLVEQIRGVRDDRSVRAIVLRIDSPGGVDRGLRRDLARADDYARSRSRRGR
jgi:hypothetical protein